MEDGGHGAYSGYAGSFPSKFRNADTVVHPVERLFKINGHQIDGRTVIFEVVQDVVLGFHQEVVDSTTLLSSKLGWTEVTISVFKSSSRNDSSRFE